MSAPDMKTSEILRKARELITPKRTWIKGEIAINKSRSPLMYGDDPDAVCWCSLGILEKVAGRYTDAKEIAHNYLLDAINRSGLVSLWNDAPKRTHAQVLAAFDKAAALAEADEARNAEPAR